MPANEEQSAASFVPDDRTLSALQEAVQHCRGCDLYQNATQAVFGELETGARARRPKVAIICGVRLIYVRDVGASPWSAPHIGPNPSGTMNNNTSLPSIFSSIQSSNAAIVHPFIPSVKFCGHGDLAGGSAACPLIGWFGDFATVTIGTVGTL